MKRTAVLDVDCRALAVAIVQAIEDMIEKDTCILDSGEFPDGTGRRDPFERGVTQGMKMARQVAASAGGLTNRITVLDDEQLIHLVAKIIAWSGGEDDDQIEKIAKATEFQDAAQQCCEDLGLL